MEKSFILGIKDLDRHLVMYLDDRDVLNMMLNKDYKNLLDENFFHNLLLKKYPLLIRLKKKEETWKQFYLRQVYYLAKVKELHGIDYIPTPSYFPKRANDETKKGLNHILFSYSFLNDEKGIKLFLEKGADKNSGLMGAVSAKNKKLIEYFISLGANDFNTSVYVASSNNDKELVDYFLNKGGSTEEAMGGAVIGNHKDMIEYLLEKGATIEDLNYALMNAKTPEMVDFLKEKGANNFEKGLSRAGTKEMIDKFISMGAKNVNSALQNYVQKHHRNTTEIVNYLIDLGATLLNRSLMISASHGNIDALKVLIQRGATNIEEAKAHALRVSQGRYPQAKKSYDYLNSL
jgi:ankyrin repeat protein